MSEPVLWPDGSTVLWPNGNAVFWPVAVPPVSLFYRVPGPIQLFYDEDGMTEYNPDQEIHVGEDISFEADFDPCSDDAPDLTGLTFQFTAVPIDGTGATITKSVSIDDTTLTWSLDAADTATRLGEIFRCQVRRTNSGNNRVWVEFTLTVIA